MEHYPAHTLRDVLDMPYCAFRALLRATLEPSQPRASDEEAQIVRMHEWRKTHPREAR